MTVATSSTKCFIFASKFDAAIYRYLVTNHRDEMESIKASTIEQIEQWRENGEELLVKMSLAARLDWQLRELFGNQSPIAVDPVDGAYFDDSDIFEELLSDAIQRCDFERIAEAFLAGIELPAYGEDRQEAEVEDATEAAAPTAVK